MVKADDYEFVEVGEVSATKRKKKPARERGYMSIEEVATSLRALANQLVQDNKGRLAKVSLNVWYEDDDEVIADAMAGASDE